MMFAFSYGFSIHSRPHISPASRRLEPRRREFQLQRAATATHVHVPQGIGKIIGKPEENHRKTMGKWWFNAIELDLPPGNDCYIANWKITSVILGKSTVSMGHFQWT